MKNRLLACILLLFGGVRIFALDFGYSLRVGGGIAMAFGGDLVASALEFGNAVASPTVPVPAPVVGALLGASLDCGIYGPLRAEFALDARRLGYALWAPPVGASTWLALWVVEARLGLRYAPDSWYLSAGAFGSAPIGGLKQATHQGDASVDVSYDIDAGRAFIPGAYLEAGLRIPGRIPLGKLNLFPYACLEAGLWPSGILDGVKAWQGSLTLLVNLKMERRASDE